MKSFRGMGGRGAPEAQPSEYSIFELFFLDAAGTKTENDLEAAVRCLTLLLRRVVSNVSAGNPIWPLNDAGKAEIVCLSAVGCFIDSGAEEKPGPKNILLSRVCEKVLLLLSRIVQCVAASLAALAAGGEARTTDRGLRGVDSAVNSFVFGELLLILMNSAPKTVNWMRCRYLASDLLEVWIENLISTSIPNMAII